MSIILILDWFRKRFLFDIDRFIHGIFKYFLAFNWKKNKKEKLQFEVKNKLVSVLVFWDSFSFGDTQMTPFISTQCQGCILIYEWGASWILGRHSSGRNRKNPRKLPSSSRHVNLWPTKSKRIVARMRHFHNFIANKTSLKKESVSFSI